MMIKTAERESVKKAKVGSPATLTLAWPSKLLRLPHKLCRKRTKKTERERSRRAAQSGMQKEDKATREKGLSCSCKCRGQCYGMWQRGGERRCRGGRGKRALQSGNSDTHRIILMEIHNERRFKKFHVAKGDTARKLSPVLSVAGDF